MKIPEKTGEIFEVLSKGGFICSNAVQSKNRRLYELIEDGDNYAVLHAYFLAIHFVLEKGNEYYYFSRQENRADLERKLEAAYRWIDLVDFFKTFDPSFGPGYAFTASDITVKLHVDVNLKNKLDALRRHNKEEAYLDSVCKLIDRLCNDGYAELENERLETYKVLSSFHHLESLIHAISIPEDVKNEIPQ